MALGFASATAAETPLSGVLNSCNTLPMGYINGHRKGVRRRAISSVDGRWLPGETLNRSVQMGSNFKGRSFLLASFSVIVAGLALALGCSHDDPDTTPQPPTTPQSKAAAPAPSKVKPQNQANKLESAAKTAKVDEAEDDQLDVSELVKRYDNAVVFITTYDVLGEKTGSGTGCVLSSDGLVATSYHVLADAATAQAQLKDGETITSFGLPRSRSRPRFGHPAIGALPCGPGAL